MLMIAGAGGLALIVGASVARFMPKGVPFFRSGRDAARDGAAVLGVVLPDLQGTPQALAQWRGDVLVVNFWATWCEPCRTEMPRFIAAQAREAGKGVQFVGIAVDDTDRVRDFARRIGLNYPALIGGYGAIELSQALGNDAGALPFTIVVDRKGRVAETHLGPIDEASLERVLADLLPG